MLFLYYVILFILILFAFAFIWPALSHNQFKIIVFCVLFLVVLALNLGLGESQHLTAYYSIQGKKLRSDQDRMRPLFTELKKQQGRLLLVLIENPEDVLAKALLLELMGVESLYRHDKKLALSFFEAALKLLPEKSETILIRTRINHLKGLISNYT